MEKYKQQDTVKYFGPGVADHKCHSVDFYYTA